MRRARNRPCVGGALAPGSNHGAPYPGLVSRSEEVALPRARDPRLSSTRPGCDLDANPGRQVPRPIVFHLVSELAWRHVRFGSHAAGGWPSPAEPMDPTLSPWSLTALPRRLRRDGRCFHSFAGEGHHRAECCTPTTPRQAAVRSMGSRSLHRMHSRAHRLRRLPRVLEALSRHR